MLSERLEEALAPFRKEGFQATYDSPSLVEAGEFMLDEVERHGLSVVPESQLRQVNASSQIGDTEPQDLSIGVVPLAGDSDPRVALILLDPWAVAGESRPLFLTPEEVGERAIRTWIDAWLVRLLVDYARRL